MEDARSALKLAEQQLKEKEQSYQQQVQVRTELDQQIQQYKKEKESGLTISNEEDQDDGIVDKANELLMSLSLQGGTTPSEQDEYDMKIIRQMCSTVMNRRIDRLSNRSKEEQRKERDISATVAVVKEACVRLTAEAEAKEKHYRLVAEAKEEAEQERLASQLAQQQMVQQHQQVLQQRSLQHQEVESSETELQAKVENSLHSQRIRVFLNRQRQQQNERIQQQRHQIQHDDTVEQQILELNQRLSVQEKEQQKKLRRLQRFVSISSITLSLRFVQIDTDRFPLPDTIRGELTKALIQSLSSVVVDENNNVKGAFQLSYCKPRSDEPDVIKVYGIPHIRLPPVDHNLFSSNNTFVDQRQFANQYQVTLSLLEEQVISAIEQASSSVDQPSSSVELIAALQQILNDTYYGNNTVSQEERTRQFFFFKGVVYFVWIDVPLEVLEMLKETCKDVYEDVRAVKIGESGEDLIKHLEKMHKLLTYLAGAKLCWIAIGIPFGLCSSRMVEQWIHFIKLELRKSGEWHSRKVLSLETIKHILERTGGKVICRGTVSHGGQSGDGFVNIRSAGEDGPGWIYFFCQLFTEEELKELWKIYNKLSEGEGRHFIRFLLAFKVGASRGDYTKRLRKNFWAMVRGSGKFVAVKGFSEVFKQEAWLHKYYERLQVCGERFMLTDANGNSAIETLLKLIRNHGSYNIEEGEVHREHEKLCYMEEETKEWIRRDFMFLVDFVKGVVGYYKLDEGVRY